VQIVMAPGWQENLLAATDVLFENTLGPEISEDAKSYCPVFFGENSTAGEVSLQIATSLGTPMPGGSLRDSVEFHLLGHNLIVAATGDGERSYAVYVEMGHAVVVFRHDMGWRKDGQPFLRPALYTVRGTYQLGMAE
jgi:hypothetical protein